MLQIDAIREGFHHAHKNWQLVLLQLVMSLMLFVGLLVVVAVFIVAAIVVLGFDLSRLDALGDWLGTVKDPVDILTNYAGLAVGLGFGFLLYSVFSMTVWIFTLGGSAGVLGISITHPEAHFGPRDFIAEGRLLFWRIAALTSITGLIFIAALVAMGVLAGGGSALWDAFVSKGTRWSIFMAVLMALVAFTVMMLVMIYLFALTAWGLAELVFDEKISAMNAVRRAEEFIRLKPESFGLLLLAIMLMIFVQFILMAVWYPVSMSPVLGIFVTLPFQVVAYTVQGYVNLALMGSVLAYYYHARLSTERQHTGSGKESPEAHTHGGSAPEAQNAQQTSAETSPQPLP